MKYKFTKLTILCLLPMAAFAESIPAPDYSTLSYNHADNSGVLIDNSSITNPMGIDSVYIASTKPIIAGEKGKSFRNYLVVCGQRKFVEFQEGEYVSIESIQEFRALKLYSVVPDSAAGMVYNFVCNPSSRADYPRENESESERMDRISRKALKGMN